MQLNIEKLVLDLPTALASRKHSIKRLLQQELKQQMVQHIYFAEQPYIFDELQLPTIHYSKEQTDLHLAKQLARELITVVLKKTIERENYDR